MKRILLTSLFILLLSNLAYSQNKLAELEKIKQIRIFESKYEDVQRLLPKYFEGDFDSFSTMLRTEIGYLMIAFSEGNCGEDEYWNVKKGLVTGVSISNISEVKIKDLGFNLKIFRKEIEDKDIPEEVSYHDEQKGITIRVEEKEVTEIVFYPPKSKRNLLCKNENTADIISGKQKLVDTVTIIACLLVNQPAVVYQITLSSSKLSVNSKGEDKKITVRVSASDPENDVLTYVYKVSGGKIDGRGAIVTWDLSGVKSGTYTITVGVDDGTGIKSEMKTKTVVVK